MLKHHSFVLLFTVLVAAQSASSHTGVDWGFFSHRMINRYAVFTLPQAMLPLFKTNINYLEEHAIDPDKRRYATQYEAVRHYIDIDHWGSYPYENVPRDFGEAVTKFSDLVLVSHAGDSVLVEKIFTGDSICFKAEGWALLTASRSDFLWFFNKNLLQGYYKEEWEIPASSFDVFFRTNTFAPHYKSFIIHDRFTEYGILPYHLIRHQANLTKAFLDGDHAAVLRSAADLGHYIGDAHVPLHTTENYNGQLTDQLGIHAFWESRLPELFHEEFDLFVGKAEYIEDKTKYFWDMVLSSNAYVDDVLKLERQLSSSFPSDLQFCYDERLNNTVRIQCEEYSRAYHELMQGMVEERFAASIKAIGDAWFTAWVDAGQPVLSKEAVKIEAEEIIADEKVKTREHNN